jgi:hypothetical protein
MTVLINLVQALPYFSDMFTGLFFIKKKDNQFFSRTCPASPFFLEGGIEIGL